MGFILYVIIPAVIIMTLVDHAQWIRYLLDTHVDVCELLGPYMQNQN